jgi:hypothetical protein
MDAFTKLASAEGAAQVLENYTAAAIRVDRIGRIPHALFHLTCKY